MADKSKIDVGAVRAALDEQDNPWVAQENALTAMPKDKRVRRLGVPLPDDDHRATLDRRAARARAQAKAGAGAAAALPAAFNLNDIGGTSYVSGVRDQGYCGSCVAFGSVGVLEGTARYGRRTPSLDVDLSEAHLFYGWGGTVGVTCDTGWMPLPALTFCTSSGITYESDWAYSAGNSNGGSAPASWQQHRAQATGTVDLTSKVSDIKQHLIDVGPVTGCFIVYTDFYSYHSGVYQHTWGDEEGGHCVTIVGYDDAAGAWIVKNSWNTSWGQDGFGMIKYGECYIDAWSNIAVTGVKLRTWTSAKKVIGAYSTGHERNGWVYVQDNGWLKVGGGAGTAHVAMFADLLTAKEKNAYVNAFADDGSITQTYAY